MKSSLFNTFLLLLSVTGISLIIYSTSYVAEKPSPCDTPLTYQVGRIDSRFNISRNEVLDIMEKVEGLWFTALDKPMLKYDKDGRVVINLVYGNNQQKTDAAKSYYRQIESKKERLKIHQEEYKRLQNQYKTAQKVFKRKLDSYNDYVNNFNAYVDKWNARDSVPAEVRNKVRRGQHKMESDQKRLKSQRNDNEALRKKLNGKADQLKKLSGAVNKMISTYNKHYGTAEKFNEGYYSKKGSDEKITIFQFANKAELKTVLAHESGHALGLKHVSNPKSVMFELMDKQDIFNLSLSKEDKDAIKRQCR